MYWIDSHCHINDVAYKDDLNDVLNRMLESNVKEAMIISCNIDDYLIAKGINKDGLTFKKSLGIYPGDVDKYDINDLDDFKKYYVENDCEAIGEIGLDYYYGKDNKDKQIELFKAQCEIAKELNKPVIIHSRDAVQDTFNILKYYGNKGVMHCYSDSKEMAKEFIKLGFYISISGTVTFKNAKEPLEVIKTVPLNRLLIETDCPYLTPSPFRGKRNEPSYVKYTGLRIIEELNIDEESFKKQLVINYHECFK